MSNGENMPGETPVGLVLDFGTTAYPVANAATNKRVINGVFTDTSAGTGRFMYLLHNANGASYEGEVLRPVMAVNAAAAVGVHAMHASIRFGASGGVLNTGEAAVVRGTVEVPNRPLTGPIAGVYSELYASGTLSDALAASPCALFRADINGDATGVHLLEDHAYFLNIEGPALTIAAGNIFCAASATTATHKLRCRVNGVNYWLMLTTAE